MEVSGLFGGALLGAVAGHLLKEVLQAKDNISSFRPKFQRLESTLLSIIPRINRIAGLNHELNIQEHDMEKFRVIVRDGISLVLECGQISRFMCFKKHQYGKKLTELDGRLKDYFLTLLPLDHFRNDLEMLKIVRDLHDQLVAGSSTADPDDTDESEFLISTAAYRTKGKNLYLIKEYPHDLDLVELSNSDCKALSKGEYTITYRYRTKFGNVVMKSLTHDVKMTNKEFQQRMEEIGKIGKHPNIVLPFGYHFSDLDKFLLYDYADAGSLSSFLKEATHVGSGYDWKNMLNIILGIAKGIHHIHSVTGFVHGNIKSSKVILINRDGALDGCITDFRLAPIVNFPEPASTTGLLHRVLDPQLPAPELRTTKEATQQSDVYDFGVMLHETVSSYRTSYWHPHMLVEKTKIHHIVHKCTKDDCSRRPKIDEVVEMIVKVISKHHV